MGCSLGEPALGDEGLPLPASLPVVSTRCRLRGALLGLLALLLSSLLSLLSSAGALLALGGARLKLVCFLGLPAFGLAACMCCGLLLRLLLRLLVELSLVVLLAARATCLGLPGPGDPSASDEESLAMAASSCCCTAADALWLSWCTSRGLPGLLGLLGVPPSACMHQDGWWWVPGRCLTTEHFDARQHQGMGCLGIRAWGA
jgi:hypothetical protein